MNLIANFLRFIVWKVESEGQKITLIIIGENRTRILYLNQIIHSIETSYPDKVTSLTSYACILTILLMFTSHATW